MESQKMVTVERLLMELNSGLVQLVHAVEMILSVDMENVMDVFQRINAQVDVQIVMQPKARCVVKGSKLNVKTMAVDIAEVMEHVWSLRSLTLVLNITLVTLAKALLTHVEQIQITLIFVILPLITSLMPINNQVEVLPFL